MRSNNLGQIDQVSAISGLTQVPKHLLKKHSSDERPSEQSQGSKIVFSAVVQKDALPILTSNQSVRVFTTKTTPKEQQTIMDKEAETQSHNSFMSYGVQRRISSNEEMPQAILQPILKRQSTMLIENQGSNNIEMGLDPNAMSNARQRNHF